jgi:hypothetical protein
MPIIKQFKCDGCGSEKKEANHWFTVSIFEGTLRIQRLETAMRAGLTEDMEIICGQECVAKKVSEWMGRK